MQNLRKLYPEMTVVTKGGFSVLTKSGELESSWLLVRDFWAEQARSVKGEIVAAVPARDTLIFGDSASRASMERLRIIVEAANKEAGSRGVSKLLYVFRKGWWEVFELPAIGQLPEEKVEEPRLPGPKLSSESLTTWLRKLSPVKTLSRTLEWVKAEEKADGALSVIFRVVDWDNSAITGVVERDWELIPVEARDEPQRVYNFLDAFVATAQTYERLDPFWIVALDPLRKSQARQRSTFERIVAAHARTLSQPRP